MNKYGMTGEGYLKDCIERECGSVANAPAQGLAGPHQPEIMVELSSLEGHSRQAEQLLSALSERLGPVLRTAAGSPGKTGPQPPMRTGLGQQLGAINIRVASLCATIEEILGSLEL